MESRRIPLNVSINPSDYSANRSFRMDQPSDIHRQIKERMREFEEDSRRWRMDIGSRDFSDPFFTNRPRMFLDFPEFPDFQHKTSLDTPFSSSRFSSPLMSSSISDNSQKTYIEEDDNGVKKYKIVFNIGDFKPNEIQVSTNGNFLNIRGEKAVIAGTTQESKQFNRQLTLPDFVEPTSVTSFLSDGQLTVEAPVLLDRLGLTSNSSTSAITNSSIRNSPYRDTQSPSRSIHKLDTLASRSNAFNNNFNRSSSPSKTLSTSNSKIYSFDLGDFKPEDIAITVTDTLLKVHAVSQEKDGSSGNTYREFKKEIGLPPNADVKHLKNSLQPNGTLTIEIPYESNISKEYDNLKKNFNDLSLNQSKEYKEIDTFQQTKQKQQQHQLQEQQSSQYKEINVINDGKNLKITFDLTGYKPEDLSIKVIDNKTLKVHAEQHNMGENSSVHREYTRSYQLPDWVEPELLRARMGDNGILTVEIPVPQSAGPQQNKYDQSIKIIR